MDCPCNDWHDDIFNEVQDQFMKDSNDRLSSVIALNAFDDFDSFDTEVMTSSNLIEHNYSVAFLDIGQ